jgi:SAM-dependent methyltransferase
LIKDEGMVLDVACGHGRHARYLAARGHRVVATDRDQDALRQLTGIAGVTTQVADLEHAPWPFSQDAFDGIVVTNYLHRPLFGALAASLAAGGVLIYETFMVGNEHFGKPTNPDFLLRPRELLDAFTTLTVVAFEQGLVERPKRAVVQRICAARRAEATTAIG